MIIFGRSLCNGAQRQQRLLYQCVFVVLFASLVGCINVPSPQSRLDNVKQLASNAGWHQLNISTDRFVLTSFVPDKISTNKLLTVYIEGDGLAWITNSKISPDPSPLKPVALELALQHPNQSVAYLARPCQFVETDDAQHCAASYWTDARFSTEVIDATSQAIDALLLRFNSKQLILVGYSGGGAIAALVAARRSDVIQLVTVAGNLDHQLWTEQHRISSLSRSLNPVDFWQTLVDIKQLHLVGANDTVVDKSIAQSFQSKFPADRQPEIKVIDNFDHGCCWSQHWPEFVEIWLPI